MPRLNKRIGGGQSVFDEIGKDELIMAFFPCIYFCATSQMAFSYGCTNYRKLDDAEKTEKILQRAKDREYFYSKLIKLFSVCFKLGLRLIVENPWSEQTYLKANFILPPSLVDSDRSRRGDYFVKPTAYWFYNLKPTHGFTWQKDKEVKTIMTTKSSATAGICSEERSLIHPDYARNFICDNILGITQKRANVQLEMF